LRDDPSSNKLFLINDNVNYLSASYRINLCRVMISDAKGDVINDQKIKTIVWDLHLDTQYAATTDLQKLTWVSAPLVPRIRVIDGKSFTLFTLSWNSQGFDWLPESSRIHDSISSRHSKTARQKRALMGCPFLAANPCGDMDSALSYGVANWM
jgi:hypothetical protein